MGTFIRLNGIDECFAEINKRLEQAPELLVQRLQYIGEAAVKEARLYGSYTDQTGNLRSSIGYVILHDGVRVTGGSPKVFEDGEQGSFNMMELLEKLAAEFPVGYVLIVCAGMEYASYVEDVHGKNVLASAKQLAAQLMRKLESNK